MIEVEDGRRGSGKKGWGLGYGGNGRGGSLGARAGPRQSWQLLKADPLLVGLQGVKNGSGPGLGWGYYVLKQRKFIYLPLRTQGR